MTCAEDDYKTVRGIVVPSLYLQHQPASTLIQALTETKANAIAISGQLLEIVPPWKGVRFPDLHLDGWARRLLRPIEGRTALYVRPLSRESDLWDQHYKRVHLIIRQIQATGIRVYLQIQPLAMSFHGQGAQQVPIGPWDFPANIIVPRVARLACPNFPGVVERAIGVCVESAKLFPEVNGYMLDWVEYAAYRFLESLSCACGGCIDRANRQPGGWDLISTGVAAFLKDLCHTPGSGRDLWSRLLDVYATSSQNGFNASLAVLGSLYPGLQRLFEMKAASVGDLMRQLSQGLDITGSGRAFVLRVQPEPLNALSGSRLDSLSPFTTAIAPKLFTFDWGGLPRWYADDLLPFNSVWTETAVLKGICTALGIVPPRNGAVPSDFHVLGSSEQHPVDGSIVRRKINAARNEVGESGVAITPILYPGLPLAQWEEVAYSATATSPDGLWVNGYSYLGPTHMAVLRDVWRG